MGRRPKTKPIILESELPKSKEKEIDNQDEKPTSDIL